MSAPCLWCGQPFANHDIEEMRECVDFLYERVQGMAAERGVLIGAMTEALAESGPA